MMFRVCASVCVCVCVCVGEGVAEPPFGTITYKGKYLMLYEPHPFKAFLGQHE